MMARNRTGYGSECFHTSRGITVIRLSMSVAAIAAALALAACGNDAPNTPAPKTSGTTSDQVATQSTVPPAQADRDSPPAMPPATHSGTPQPEAPAAPTARDTAANQPLGELPKSQETSSLPKAGQVNNHSSTAMDQENKTTPPDGGAGVAK
jgi:hypothetical protein